MTGLGGAGVTLSRTRVEGVEPTATLPRRRTCCVALTQPSTTPEEPR